MTRDFGVPLVAIEASHPTLVLLQDHHRFGTLLPRLVCKATKIQEDQTCGFTLFPRSQERAPPMVLLTKHGSYRYQPSLELQNAEPHHTTSFSQLKTQGPPRKTFGPLDFRPSCPAWHGCHVSVLGRVALVCHGVPIQHPLPDLAIDTTLTGERLRPAIAPRSLRRPKHGPLAGRGVKTREQIDGELFFLNAKGQEIGPIGSFLELQSLCPLRYCVWVGPATRAVESFLKLGFGASI